MDELRERLQWMLNLPVGATVEDIKAQFDKLIEQISNGQGMAAASVDLLALLANQKQQIAALSQQLTQQTTEPDPTKFVSIDVVNALNSQIAALSQKNMTDEGQTLVQAALTDNRITPAEATWLGSVGKKDVNAVKAYLDGKPVIAALSQTQTSVTKPLATQEADLDATALAICSQLGITKEQFKAQQALLSK